MDRKHFLGLSVVLSLSLLVACGDKTNTQEPPQEPDQSVVQQEQNVQPEEIKQKVPVEPKEEVKPEEKSSENNTLNKDEAVDTSAEATFAPIREEEDSGISKYLAVTRVIKGGKAGDLYELVSNRFKLEIVDENKLKALLSLISVGGATLDEKGKVVIHKGVVVEQTTEDQDKNQNGSKNKDGQK